MTKEQAQQRNFIKYRLSGIVINTELEQLTDEERNNLKEIKQKIDLLISNWDNNSLLFVDKNSSVNKNYKCWCGQRSNIKRIGYDYDNKQVNFCRKHYIQYLKEQEINK